MNRRQYIRTDLAAECPVIEKSSPLPGISTSKYKMNISEITAIEITSEEGSSQLNKPIGTYITMSFEKTQNLSENDCNTLSKEISQQIKTLSHVFLVEKKMPKIFVVGLGNRYITPDAIGPLSVKGVTATRHIEMRDKELFKILCTKNISAISPGVVGQTGIETYDIIKGCVDTVKPDLVIAVDALASRSVDRLATTVQLCDSGIAPGSGLGNHRKAINKDTIGVPVISIGVPTMVSSSTLVYDALEKSGIDDISDELEIILNNGKSFYVTPNDCDLIVSTLSEIIADAINMAFETEN